MPFHTTDREGITRLNPDTDTMRAIIASLQDDVPEHPDVWLTHDSGWTISLFPSGLAVLENEHTHNTSQIENITPDQALQMWLQLSQGNVQSLLKQNWQHTDS